MIRCVDEGMIDVVIDVVIDVLIDVLVYWLMYWLIYWCTDVLINALINTPTLTLILASANEWIDALIAAGCQEMNEKK